MKKLFLALLFIIPLVAFSQEQTFPSKEKKAIDSYLNTFCECLNEVLSTLNPTMIEYMQIFADSGEATAQKFINNYVENATEEEVNNFLASANMMQNEAFISKLDNCDDKGTMSQKSIDSIDNEKGESYDYLMKSMSKNIQCKFTEMFIKMGSEE